MDRTAGNTDWIVVRPPPNDPSDCIIPAYLFPTHRGSCTNVYTADNIANHIDPVTDLPYGDPTVAAPTGLVIPGYIGFDPATAPNGGEGFYKDLSHNQMPNAPPFTLSFGAQYSMPLSPDWAGTLHGDFYWQSDSFWRVFNDLDYDRLRGYTNFNLTLILTNQAGWQVMLYDKNIFNTTAITGAFLNSDDSGLTTNVFLTDPKLIGIRVTKNW
jgi:outer membrane receptor protein involved in Fe transport